MQKAAIINAGLGALTLGVIQAGFSVVAAYETDKKACDIHCRNIDIPLYSEVPENSESTELYGLDLLVVRVKSHVQVHSFNKAIQPNMEDYGWWSVLHFCHPRCCLFFLNAQSEKKILPSFLETVSNEGYQLEYRIIDVGETCGFPIHEHMICAVGIRNDLEENKKCILQETNSSNRQPSQSFLQLGQLVDPWYFMVRDDFPPTGPSEQPFLCWEHGRYKETGFLMWNYSKIPLVRDISGTRKITHSEIAAIKRFPESYIWPKKNKQWLYKALMDSENVEVVQQTAHVLLRLLEENSWRPRQINRGTQFEMLFHRYLRCLSDKHAGLHCSIEWGTIKEPFRYNFIFRQGNHSLLFELKCYSSNTGLFSKIKEVCYRMLSFTKSEGTLVLVVANIVPEDIKQQCYENYSIRVWDVSNLLWLFNEFADLKKELIAFLDYSLEGVPESPPIPEILQDGQTTNQKEPNWKEKLQSIVPGKKHYLVYEDTCVEILKYVLGDYLTLWEKQAPSNDGLYRFDLCCKIKNGVDQEFFDTIKSYFNTKYIVFEFKNYNEKISQKEIYTTEKYLYEKALRKVAIIISRSGADNHAQQAAKGSLRENGKLILCLSDRDLLEMIDIKEQKEDQEPADYLSALLDDLLVHLEK